MRNFVARVLGVYPLRDMSRRALIFTSVSIFLLIWCTTTTLFAFYAIQIFRRVFLSNASFRHDFSFQECTARHIHIAAGDALCSSDIPTGYRAGIRSDLRVSVTLTLPESDENHEMSTNAITICTSSSSAARTPVCKRNVPLSLRYRTPIHRGVRAVFLAVPLLFGLVDEYQRVKVSLVLPVSNSISISMQKSWQISNSSVQIIPYFSWLPPVYLLLLITVFWYLSLLCAFIAYRMFERVQNSILAAIFPKEEVVSPPPSSPAVMIEELKEEDEKEDTTKFGDLQIVPISHSATCSSSFSSPPDNDADSMNSATTTITSEIERSDSNGRRGLRRRKTYGGKPPDCLLNGKY